MTRLHLLTVTCACDIDNSDDVVDDNNNNNNNNNSPFIQHDNRTLLYELT